MEHKTVTIELTESNARFTLIALRELNEKLQDLSNDESIDEDEQFFYAYDLMESSRAYEKIEKLCVDAFGTRVLEHNHDAL
jgi:hypothetical protein